MTFPISTAIRLKQLDSIRGIAALVVLFGHYIQVVPEAIRQLSGFPGGAFNLESWTTPWPWLRFTPLRLIVDGHAAVIVFFLLSGFVLALPVTADRQPEFLPFIIKRVCRIFVPFASVTLLIIFSYNIFPISARAEVSNWFNSYIPIWENVSLSDHLFMTGKDISLNPVMWSLLHEMRMSFVLLPIFWLMRQYGSVRTVGFSLAFSFICSFFTSHTDNGTSWQATSHFFWLFPAGAAIAYNRDRIQRFACGFSNRVRLALWVISLGLLAVPFDRNWCDFLIGAGAILLIVLTIIPGKISCALSTRVPVWLGRISYSLYLVHWPILFVVISYNVMPLWMAFILTLIMAELSYRFIEKPSHRLGVFLENKVFYFMHLKGLLRTK